MTADLHKKDSDPGSGQAGLTLIEAVIVLVIAGLITTAGIAGLDLVRNAQAGKVVTWVRGWEQSMLSFLDRRGRFAGDADRDGIITGQPRTELEGAGLQNLPDESMLYASTRFFMHIGNSGGDDPRNVLVVTRLDESSVFLGLDCIAMGVVDTSIDGRDDPSSGRVRGYDDVSLDENGTVTSLGSSVENFDEAVALAYFFDRPPSDEDGYLYYDSFDNLDLMDMATDSWGNGGWTINEDGTLSASGSGYVLLGDESWEDYTVSVEISMEDGKSGMALLYLASSSDDQYLPLGYAVQIDSDAGDRIILKKYTTDESGNVVQETLASVSFSDIGFDASDSNTVSVSVSGTEQVISVNGEVVITYTDDSDTAYTSGSVGLRTWDNSGDVLETATVDELIVTAN